MFDWIIPPPSLSISSSFSFSLIILNLKLLRDGPGLELYYIMIPASNCTMSPIFSWNIQIIWVVGYVVGDIWYRYSAMNSVSLHLSSILLHTQPFTINMLLCFLLFEIVFYYSLEVFRNLKTKNTLQSTTVSGGKVEFFWDQLFRCEMLPEILFFRLLFPKICQ